MRPTCPELMQGLFYLALIVAIIVFTAHAIGVLDGIETRQQQSTLHHENIIALADKALADHTRFLQDHDAMLGRLPSGR